jgi:proteasome accessory factor C
MTANAASRLARLLALVPYLVSHPGARVADVAELFQVSERDLRADLDLLFVCGLPGYSPGDLIDVDYEGDRVTLRNAETIARPLRLSPDEALSLVVAARTLAAVPGLQERDALDRALAKLEAICAPALPDGDAVRVALEPEGERLSEVEAALRDGRRVHLRYHTQARDEVTERDVDPIRVLSMEGRWYLEGYCRRVEGVRLFRLDRILDLTVLDSSAEVPADAAPRDLDDGLFQPSADMTLVRLEVDATARWVADYYPCEHVDALPAEGLRLALRVGDTAWVRRLVLRLGRHARVIAPPELAVEVEQAARAALLAYGA